MLRFKKVGDPPPSSPSHIQGVVVALDRLKSETWDSTYVLSLFQGTCLFAVLLKGNQKESAGSGPRGPPPKDTPARVLKFRESRGTNPNGQNSNPKGGTHIWNPKSPSMSQAVGQKWVPNMACPGKWTHGLKPAVPGWLDFGLQHNVGKIAIRMLRLPCLSVGAYEILCPWDMLQIPPLPKKPFNGLVHLNIGVVGHGGSEKCVQCMKAHRWTQCPLAIGAA